MIFSKKNTRFSIMGMLAAVFTVGCLLTGCGDSASGSGDAKYLLYKKEGNAKDGYYMHVIGLNTECDKGGVLKVNLDDIFNKNQGKITIPAQIDGLPVKKVTLCPSSQKELLGGIVADTGSIRLRTVTAPEMKFYLDDTKTYYDYVSDIVLPDGVEEVDLLGLKLENLTLPGSVKEFDGRHITGKLVIPVKAYISSSWGVGANHLEVFATDDTPVDKEVRVKAVKSAKFPPNIKKFDLSALFNSSISGWDKAYKLREECKNFEMTCAPDATITLGGDERLIIPNLIYSSSVKINNKYISDYFKK